MTTLVTGGTGSFGHAYVKAHPGEPIRVLSRDEEKQRAMRVEYPDLELAIGDVRDRDALRRAMRGCDKVFHAAALKQVPQCEDHPDEAYRTNVAGTENVCLVAQEQGARVVLLSTDKAVLPVGVMGATKMLAEAIATSYGFNVVRYGNVIGSRGSILPIFRDQMVRGVPITITDPLMTRFLITLDQAIELVDLAMNWHQGGRIFVRKSPAATVAQFVKALAPDYPTEIIGVRPGEKRHEDLLAAHERVCEEFDRFYIVERNKPGGATYTSEHAPRLSDAALAELLAAA